MLCIFPRDPLLRSRAHFCNDPSQTDCRIFNHFREGCRRNFVTPHKRSFFLFLSGCVPLQFYSAAKKQATEQTWKKASRPLSEAINERHCEIRATDVEWREHTAVEIFPLPRCHHDMTIPSHPVAAYVRSQISWQLICLRTQPGCSLELYIRVHSKLEGDAWWD